jgi:PKD repeat protein
VVNADSFAPAYANGVVAQDGQTVQQDFHLYPICDVFTDNVEGGNLGWTAQAPWAITTEASHSPTHSWTDSPGGNYQDNRNITLTSPAFDLSDATGVTLNFWHEYQTEAGWDYGTVEYNAGNGWIAVQAYDGFQDWTQESLSIPSLDGEPNAQIRFHFTSDLNTNYDGWHIDDISLTAGGPGCMAPTEPTAGFSSNSPVHLGDPMNFTNQTVGSEPMTYTWNFGDGIGTSTDINPTYTYTVTGTYTVQLDATNNLGTDSITHTVKVLPSAITSVDLTQVTTGSLFPGEAVSFNADLHPDEGTSPFQYTLDFGDGAVVTGTSEMDPLLFFHVYTFSGPYTVKISVWNDGTPQPVTDSIDVYINFEIFLPLTSK